MSRCHQELRRAVRGVRFHVSRVSSVQLKPSGLPIAAPLEMLSQLRRSLSLVEWVTLADAMVASRLLAIDTVIACHQLGPQRTFVRDRVDSPRETATRLLVHFAGLPTPEVNGVIWDSTGEPIRRGDLVYRSSKTLIEYEGGHHFARDQYALDLLRRQQLESLGWRIVNLTAKDFHGNHAKALRRIHETLRERKEPGTPRTMSNRWRIYFG